MMSELIPVATPYIIEEDAKAVYDCVLSTWISMGKGVETFENQFAEYVGSKFAIAMNNGTSTLHASLAALGIGPGDEVIIPTLTYISTVNVVLFQGAKPILCESNPKTYNVDVGNVQKLVTKNTKAVITVDMNGLPIDYDQWKKFSDEYKIPIIADSAESCGAIYKNNYVGSQLFAHSFSFFPNKNLTTGEGGMVTTNDKEFAETLRILRNQGQDYRYNHIKLGYNYRMTDIQAALGKVQLGRMEWVAKKKEKIKNFYNQYFLECDGVTTPFVPDYVSRPSWYMYTISLNKSIDRDKVKDRLKKKGIGTRRSFPPVHIQPYHSKILATNSEDFPISYGAWKQLLNLPVGITLTDNQLLKVVNAVKASI
jgi:perosamine synthetase